MVTEVKTAVVAGGRRGNWKEKSPQVGAKGHGHVKFGEPYTEDKCPEIRLISIQKERLAAGQTTHTLGQAGRVAVRPQGLAPVSPAPACGSAVGRENLYIWSSPATAHTDTPPCRGDGRLSTREPQDSCELQATTVTRSPYLEGRKVNSKQRTGRKGPQRDLGRVCFTPNQTTHGSFPCPPNA